MTCSFDLTEHCRCICCDSRTYTSLDNEAICRECERSYPVISGIPVLMSHADARMRFQLAETEKNNKPAESSHGAASGASEISLSVDSSRKNRRLQRYLRGSSQNSALISKHMGPLRQCITGRGGRDPRAIDWILPLNYGAPLDQMLPYFYQDWGNTASFRAASAIIAGAIESYCSDLRAVAVLGAGACGMAAVSAQYFSAVYAVDLSVPTLLLAKPILEGEVITLHVRHAGWQAVQLKRNGVMKPAVRLIGADVTGLPFGEGTLSTVVTQYITDLLPDPLRLAEQIYRTLCPGGVWINFSTPFRVSDEPRDMGPPEASELDTVLEPLGFRVVKSERTRCAFMDFQAICSQAPRFEHEVQFFVGQKLEGPAKVSRSIRSGSPVWWNAVPSILPGKQMRVIRSRTFGCGYSQESARVAAGFSSSASKDQALLIERLFEHIEGTRHLRDIWDSMESTGLAISEQDFVELINHLSSEDPVLDLSYRE